MNRLEDCNECKHKLTCKIQDEMEWYERYSPPYAEIDCKRYEYEPVRRYDPNDYRLIKRRARKDWGWEWVSAKIGIGRFSLNAGWNIDKHVTFGATVCVVDGVSICLGIFYVGFSWME